MAQDATEHLAPLLLLPLHSPGTEVALGIVGVRRTGDYDTAATAGMDKEEGIARPYLRHNTHMTYTGAYPAAREEHEVTRAYLAALDGSILGILVTRRASDRDAILTIDITRKARAVEAARVCTATAIFLTKERHSLRENDVTICLSNSIDIILCHL